MKARNRDPLLSRAEQKAEAIAAKDLNNLYLTSCYFRDPEKYRAFCSLYALMRVVDDRIDDLIAAGELSAAERAREHEILRAWESQFQAMVDGDEVDPELIRICERPDAIDLLFAAAHAMRRFPIPRLLWTEFFAAMHRDVEQVPFETYRDFLGYARGASAAPTSIYLCLIAADRSGSQFRYDLPAAFDPIRCGHHLGTFAYLSHILRDLAQDLDAGKHGLVYLARKDLERFGLTVAELHEDRRRKQARPALRELAFDLAERARDSMRRGVQLLAPIENLLTPDCQFILQLIVRIYDGIIDKLAAVSFDPMTDGHHLTPADKRRIAREVAEPLGFSIRPRLATAWAYLRR